MKIHQIRNNLKNMTGMMIVMVLCMGSSLTIGIIVGIFYTSDLTHSTMIAMTFSLIVGYLAGKPINLLAIGEGMAGGIMGGMMGAMLGDMLPLGNYTAMLIYMDILFIVSILFIVTMMNTELKKDKENLTFKPRTYPWIITTIISAILIFAFSNMEADTIESHQDQKDQHEHHH
ncbi:hypothetical protein [Domibacillus aminovorans]|uniref:Uncharacterized protein n=1 Tax=Domibacillus aminovorans TaxID=29332 RepID=A0A177L7Y2_9BACI|nr:hypothetical protein [Domibacillus aminovorans]OAH61496.1 hypothetical protein AWH49_12480 [Domibacillus aminovorans]